MEENFTPSKGWLPSLSDPVYSLTASPSCVLLTAPCVPQGALVRISLHFPSNSESLAVENCVKQMKHAGHETWVDVIKREAGDHELRARCQLLWAAAPARRRKSGLRKQQQQQQHDHTRSQWLNHCSVAMFCSHRETCEERQVSLDEMKEELGKAQHVFKSLLLQRTWPSFLLLVPPPAVKYSICAGLLRSCAADTTIKKWLKELIILRFSLGLVPSLHSLCYMHFRWHRLNQLNEANRVI